MVNAQAIEQEIADGIGDRKFAVKAFGKVKGLHFGEHR